MVNNSTCSNRKQANLSTLQMGLPSSTLKKEHVTLFQIMRTLWDGQQNEEVIIQMIDIKLQVMERRVQRFQFIPQGHQPRSLLILSHYAIYIYESEQGAEGRKASHFQICYRLVLRNVMVSTITAKLLLDVIEWYGSRPPPFGLLLRWVLPPPRHEYNLQVQKQWPNNYEKHHTSINWEQGSGFKWVKKEIPLKYQQKARKFTWRFSFWGIGGSEPMILCNSFSEHTGSQKRLLFIWISC